MSETQQRKNPTEHLADMIEAGMPLIRENHNCTLRKDGEEFCGCALGMALVGQAGEPTSAHEMWVARSSKRLFFFYRDMATSLGIPALLVNKVNSSHVWRTPAEDIVKLLRRGNFDRFVK